MFPCCPCWPLPCHWPILYWHWLAVGQSQETNSQHQILSNSGSRLHGGVTMTIWVVRTNSDPEGKCCFPITQTTHFDNIDHLLIFLFNTYCKAGKILFRSRRKSKEQRKRRCRLPHTFTFPSFDATGLDHDHDCAKYDEKETVIGLRTF